MSYSRALLALGALALQACIPAEAHLSGRNLLLAEVGTAGDVHHTTPCDASVVGSVAACFNDDLDAVNNSDFPFMATPFTTYPTDGSAWGIHLTGPYPDGFSYLISWQSLAPQTGYPETLTYRNGSGSAIVKLSERAGGTSAPSAVTFSGSMSHYLRAFTDASGLRRFSYLSPVLNHVVLAKLKASTSYHYSVGNGSMCPQKAYPPRVGLLADVGQTVNSSVTLQHILANSPDVVINAGDLAYVNKYSADEVNQALPLSNASNQNRWDTYAVLWEELYSKVPLLGAVGNHEVESTGIPAVIDYTTTSFSYPTNYPFQSYTARYPVPGTTSAFGNIDNNMYYSTVIGGVIKLITLNNYIPFHPGIPQYQWATKAFASVDRSATPWLFVQFHTSPYHTYHAHYKEMECFMSFYEDIFYAAGVDLVISGHVHAYERTHPVYKYQVDTCAPVYITIGDGGNVEGPVRNFVDEVNPATNKTYCEALTANGLTPNQVQAVGGYAWGPDFQRNVHAPYCSTTSWQPASGIAAGPVLVPLDPSLTHSSAPLGFCQSSQPLWSAYRDPSFGHGILDLLSDRTIRFSWYRNVDNVATVSDQVTLERLGSCAARRRPPPRAQYQNRKVAVAKE